MILQTPQTVGSWPGVALDFLPKGRGAPANGKTRKPWVPHRNYSRLLFTAHQLPTKRDAEQEWLQLGCSIAIAPGLTA
jgi:hypothetical protein